MNKENLMLEDRYHEPVVVEPVKRRPVGSPASFEKNSPLPNRNSNFNAPDNSPIQRSWKWRDWGFRWKQTLLFLLAGLVPLSAVLITNNFSFKEIRNINAGNLQTIAEGIADRVDRNLFERYGDVQAFGLNLVVQNKENWYQKKSELTTAMNQYVDTYDIYYLTLLVDLKGNVIAVNSRDHEGARIESGGLYEKNYKNVDWFQKAKEGRFYTSQAGNIGCRGTENMRPGSEAKQSGPRGFFQNRFSRPSRASAQNNDFGRPLAGVRPVPG